jgi:hypothetical protein
LILSKHVCLPTQAQTFMSVLLHFGIFWIPGLKEVKVQHLRK